MTLRKITFVLLALAAVALLAPADAEAQRVCFSFASDPNDDGPTFYGQPPNSVLDGSPVDATGVVTELYIQPFCNAGPVSTRKVQMRYRAELDPYQSFFFNGSWTNNWGTGGLVRFVDLNTGGVLLDIVFHRGLMTSWSLDPGVLGPTVTVQDSEDLDPNIQFLAGPELVNILVAAGYPPNLLNFGEDFSFTMTNIRNPGGGPVVVPINAATGEFFADWIAEGSFSASAGL